MVFPYPDFPNHFQNGNFFQECLNHSIAEIPLLKHFMVGVIFIFPLECQSTIFIEKEKQTV